MNDSDNPLYATMVQCHFSWCTVKKLICQYKANCKNLPTIIMKPPICVYDSNLKTTGQLDVLFIVW